MDPQWMDDLDERQRKEIRFARLYAEQFGHGTDGHNRLLLIARLSDKLTALQAQADTEPAPPDLTPPETPA